MRRSILAATLLLAGCATAPQQPTTPAQPAEVAPAQRQTTTVTGFTMQQLFGHFGPPALQVQEGRSLKLQFRGSYCVLDAYLYPGATGVLRVTYIDARTLSGADTDRTRCISTLEYPS
jgi:hypothetical protein